MILYEFCGSALLVYTYNFSNGAAGLGFAYFVGWIFAVTISGAHFTPVVTLAVYLYQGRFKEDLKYLIFEIIA